MFCYMKYFAIMLNIFASPLSFFPVKNIKCIFTRRFLHMIDILVRVSLNCQFERKALTGELHRSDQLVSMSMVICLNWQLM